ncbi:MAG: alginate export family protein, partial [Nitrospirota bacterium]|nr:alginate export family protein [Nitrospirota bacterium]
YTCVNNTSGAITTAQASCASGTTALATITSTIDNTDDIDAYSLMFTHKLDKDNTVGMNYTYVSRTDDGVELANDRNDALKLQNLGISAKGKVTGLGYKVTADKQFGSTGKGTVASATTGKSKYSGYALTAGVDYKVDPATIRANFVYGSGNKRISADNALDTKNELFQTFVGNVIDPNLPTVVYGWRVNTAVSGASLGTGIANTTAWNLGLTLAPIKDLTVALDYYLLRATKAITATSTAVGYNKKVGSEVDLKIVYKLARNLTYSINSGILFAGDFYKSGTAVATQPEDAMVLQHQLVLSF